VLPLFHWEAEQRQRSKVPPAAGVMLKQEDVALLRAISSVQGYPALLRELRKALAAKKTAKTAACNKVNTSCRASASYSNQTHSYP
jgi:hypothetical protein